MALYSQHLRHFILRCLNWVKIRRVDTWLSGDVMERKTCCYWLTTNITCDKPRHWTSVLQFTGNDAFDFHRGGTALVQHVASLSKKLTCNLLIPAQHNVSIISCVVVWICSSCDENCLSFWRYIPEHCDTSVFCSQLFWFIIWHVTPHSHRRWWVFLYENETSKSHCFCLSRVITVGLLVTKFSPFPVKHNPDR